MAAISTTFTSDGIAHHISYDLVKSLMVSPLEGQIEVMDLQRFLSPDGIPWSDEVGKSRIGAGRILKEYIDLSRKRSGNPKQYKIVSSEPSPHIQASDSLAIEVSSILRAGL
jgi:hypothetical protein